MLETNEQLKKSDIIAELRLHTNEYMTYKDAIESAQKQSMLMVGITNEFTGTGERVAQQKEIRKLYDIHERLSRFSDENGIRTISGVEIHIGHKYTSLEPLKDIQIRVAVLDELYWGVIRQDIESLKREIKDLIDRGYINVIASPEKKMDLLNNGKYREGITQALKEYYQWLVNYCKKNKVLLEVCEETLWKNEGGDFERLVYWTKLAKDNNNPIIVSSNAYITNEVGNLERAVEFLNWIEYPKSLIVNTSTKQMKLLFPERYEVSRKSRVQEILEKEIQHQKGNLHEFA